MTEYPTDEQLEQIEKWEIKSTESMHELLAFCHSLWWIPEWGWEQDGADYDIATGGWSGNESIISALKQNFIFWSLCWQSSHRGGQFIFSVPELVETKQ